jgi:hypothetical protein
MNISFQSGKILFPWKEGIPKNEVGWGTSIPWQSSFYEFLALMAK